MVEYVCLVVEISHMSDKDVDGNDNDENGDVEHDDLVPEHFLLPSNKSLKFSCFSWFVFVTIITVIVFRRFGHSDLSVTNGEEEASHRVEEHWSVVFINDRGSD